ncbi:InlB B-repeat-containing protein [Alkalibacter rhizosphaerae]|uniref:InlB B-repeat-containing protein n=1 Tax=Alkalibacter rhizosphaerae TaxID=2815577 RepID=A0A974XIA2_9FIRM|nr:InlB B-repeat-containing protein [Alkalibacter rhizosphaerae]QSX09255.1 InlB B-repeat-containing protein [Alkalibacter rhizosphaerae]
MKSKIFSLLLALLLIFTWIPGGIIAQDTDSGLGVDPGVDGITRNQTDNTPQGTLTLKSGSITAYGWVAYSVNVEQTPQGLATIGIPDGTITNITPSTLGTFMAGGDFVGKDLYMISFTGILYGVDTDTGALTEIGNTGLNSYNVTGFAYDTTTETAYVSTGANLYTIDLVDATVTLVGPMTNSSTIIDIAFNGNGGLYGIDITTDSIYQIYAPTGQASFIGNLGVDITYAQGMGFDRINNVLYGTLYDSTGNGGLYQINKDTGATTLLQSIGVEMDALAIPYEFTKVEFYDGATLLKTSHVNDGEEAVEKPAVADKAGSIFAGWNTEEDGSGTAYGVEDAIYVEEDTVLYAQWNMVDYTVTYDGNGSTGGTAPVDTKVYNMDDTVIALASTFEKTGHLFTGWNSSADGSGTAYEPDETFVMGTEDVTLYAQWTMEEYQVSYAGNGSTSGTVPTDDAAYHMDDEVIVSANAGTLAKMGYTFAGWNTKSDASGTKLAPGSAYTMGATDVVFYAQWTKDPVVITYLEQESGSVAGAADMEGNILLPEKDQEDTMKITVYLQGDKTTLDTVIQAIVEQQLKGKRYDLLDVYDLTLMKRIEHTDGTITEVMVKNEEITAPITVRIQLTSEQVDMNNLAMAYVDGSGNVTILTGMMVEVDGKAYVEFEADHFSTYALVQLQDEVNPKTGLLESANTGSVFLLILSFFFLGTVLLITSRKQRSV